MDTSFPLSDGAEYVLLVAGLFIVPRVLIRLRIPSAITCVGIGALAGMGFHAFESDTTVPLLALLGIVTLFLFAGLEVDFADLRQGSRIIGQHIVIQALLLLVATVALESALELGYRASILFALALTTPSTGFILDSIGSFGLKADQRFWVKSKAIAAELVALGVLFVTVQSESWHTLAVSAVALGAMVLLLPPTFRAFAKLVLPYAPRSEFAFLLIVALICGVITRKLGVYYLVGAFVVGLAAQRFRAVLPDLSSERFLHAVELFASFFIPFYFFKAGLRLTPEDFSWTAVIFGLVSAAVAVPVRTGLVAFHRRWILGRPLSTTWRVGAALLPTLVFTIVIADILRERFGLSPDLYGALIVYALVTTAIPAIFLGASPEFDKLPSSERAEVLEENERRNVRRPTQ
jgi:Kef-type K+ transport system membrane component KefB